MAQARVDLDEARLIAFDLNCDMKRLKKLAYYEVSHEVYLFSCKNRTHASFRPAISKRRWRRMGRLRLMPEGHKQDGRGLAGFSR